ncbi:hypothetical protein [Pseudanabaena sp. PCC 6802]|uniref:hypothetical protein n=1 Tax=Pseudanabaena sp. PCC 6802 TaxID=118173 RepID=UPI0003457C1F|nr:hypothetical protein [Pseudanabaena sp. PCC 6802]
MLLQARRLAIPTILTRAIAPVTLLGAIFSMTSGVEARNCRPLEVVGGAGTVVEKKITPGGTLLTNDNWNTDFAVPSGTNFNLYTATITPKDNANYAIKLFLKYSNNTLDKFYDQTTPLKKGKPLVITGEPRARESPYQINVLVGGLEAIGTEYLLTVSGCY